MPYQRKTQRREHSAEETAVIWTLHSIGYSAGNMSLQTSIPKSTVSFILRRLKKNKDHEYQKAIRTGRPRKLSDRGERRLTRHVSRDPFTTLASLGTPSKSGSGLSLCTTRRYLARNEYYAFRPRRKPYLTKTHKKTGSDSPVGCNIAALLTWLVFAFQTSQHLRSELIRDLHGYGGKLARRMSRKT